MVVGVYEQYACVVMIELFIAVVQCMFFIVKHAVAFV